MSVESQGPLSPNLPKSSNIFSSLPPIIPMVVIGTALIAMAQFGSTEKFAAAMAWLIFVAVLFADASGALNNVTGIMGTAKTKEVKK